MAAQSLHVNRRWLFTHTLAIAFSLSHVRQDWWADRMGPPGDTIAGYSVTILALSAGLYVLWASVRVLASQGSRAALAATFALSEVGSPNGFTIGPRVSFQSAMSAISAA
jgi:hypothetical protein